MTYYLVKLIITALVVVVVSEVAKKSTFIGAIIISIPLTSLLAFIWLYVDTKDYQKVIDLSYGTILLSIPSFAFFIILPILLKFKNLVGGVTGKLLPTDYPTSIIDGIEVTCLDVSMPIVMANAKDFGIIGNETCNLLNQNKTLLKKIEEVRLSAALEMGMGDVSGKVIPKFALLSKPLNGGTITSRYFTPKTCHETHAATGTNCIAAACLIPNTVASEITKIKASGNDKITIEHPLGLIDCLVETSLTGSSFDKDFIKSCGIYRTSRKIMDGNVYIPENIDDD